MRALNGRPGTLARVVKILCRSSFAIETDARAVSSIAAANDTSNILASTVLQPLSKPFRENADAMAAMLQDLHGKIARICEGGGEKAVERHLKRNKLPPRERIAALLDPGSPFLELSQLAGRQLYGEQCFFAHHCFSSIMLKSQFHRVTLASAQSP